MDKRLLEDNKDGENRDYTVVKDEEEHILGIFDKPLPCFGCGIGWFSFLFGFVFPFMWYYGTLLYFGNYYHKDPRERPGLGACAIAALIFTSATLVAVSIIFVASLRNS